MAPHGRAYRPLWRPALLPWVVMSGFMATLFFGPGWLAAVLAALFLATFWGSLVPLRVDRAGWSCRGVSIPWSRVVDVEPAWIWRWGSRTRALVVHRSDGPPVAFVVPGADDLLDHVRLLQRAATGDPSEIPAHLRKDREISW